MIILRRSCIDVSLGFCFCLGFQFSKSTTLETHVPEDSIFPVDEIQRHVELGNP